MSREMQAANRDSLRLFVRVTLGCRCPDEVFDSMSIEHVAGESGTTGHVRLTIGDRLLIYVLEARDSDVAEAALAALARAGLAERDSRGLNRFRLVLALPGTGALSDGIQRAFTSAAATDDRAHLHVIDAAALPQGLR